MPWLREVAEAGELTLERQANGADGAVALLADHNFGFAVQALHFILPRGHFVVLVITGLFALFVVFLAVHEHHDVGVLLNRARFTQVRELRAFIFAIFDLTRELREGHDGDLQFLGDGLETHRDFGNFVHTVFGTARAAHKLQVVHDQQIKPMCPFQTSRAGSQLADRQGRRVIDKQRAGFEVFGSLNKAAEFRFGHITRADLVRVNLGSLRQNTRGKLFGGHFERVEAHNTTVHSTLGPVSQRAFTVGLGHVVGDVGR